MPLLDSLRKGADTARAKADQMMRINRVQGEIKGIQREIESEREKIADAVMELHQQGTLSDQGLTDTCIAIEGLKAQIAEKEAQIESIRAETP
jgi:predicted  nucleic acid-binding Zn-ribbon protein